MTKILFWIGPNFTHYFIAKKIREKKNAEVFGIFDITDKPKKYFKFEEFVGFTRKWFYHENITDIKKRADTDYLANFEKKYKIPLTSIVFSERTFMEYNKFYRFNTDEILRILELECKFYEHVLEDVKPDFIIMHTPYLHQELLFFKLCKAKNIKVLELNATRFSSQGVIGFDDELKKYVDFIPDKKTRSFKELQEFFENNHIMTQYLDIKHRTKGNSNTTLLSGIEYFLNSNNTNPKTHYTYFGRNKIKVFQKVSIDKIRMRERKKFIDQNFLRNVDDGNFILFPLQTESESSLLIDAPLFVDQLDVIEKITKSMPINFNLLVKEHPMQESRSWRNIDTYKKIIHTPGVIPVHPDVPIKQVVQKAKLVITISSSVALDSLFYETPSLMIAENTFSVIPSIGKINNFSDLDKLIQEKLKMRVQEEDIEKYIQFSQKISFNFDPAGFAQDLSDYFYFSGKLVDIDITKKMIQSFYSNKSSKIEILASEYIKKMSP